MPLLPARKQDRDGDHHNLNEKVSVQMRQDWTTALGQEAAWPQAGRLGARKREAGDPFEIQSLLLPVLPRSQLVERTSFLCIYSTHITC